ncbi:MAG: GTPase Era [Bacteroidales bacterium]|nr:GTPase Era [Bacteroidales bacterium]
MSHKAGFVNIIGNPNVGKSTLMNVLVGEKLSIVTSKAQTTRHRILGIVNGDDYQIVYSDTPGILDPNYKLQKSMMQFVETAIEDADIFLMVVETGESSLNSDILKRINASGIPIVVALNKVDLHEQHAVEQHIDHWKTILENAEVIPISALHGFNVEAVVNALIENLPESPPYYPKDELTDRPMRFFVAEIIRKKALEQYKKEVPYSVEVIVDQYKEQADIIHINAYIYVARESQKIIIIGKGGRAIKQLGTDARKEIEEFVEKRVYLDLSVKVAKNWRDDENKLRRFGYDQ